jgi:hypothetical protein
VLVAAVLAVVACSPGPGESPGSSGEAVWAVEAERWIDAWYTAGAEGQENRLTFLTEDVVLEDRAGGHLVRGNQEVIRFSGLSLGAFDASVRLRTFVAADGLLNQTLWVQKGPFDVLERFEMDGAQVSHIVNGKSVGSQLRSDRIMGELEVRGDPEAADDLADRYVAFWNADDPIEADSMLYAPTATIEDSLLGRSVQGSVEIQESVGSGAWPDLPETGVASLGAWPETVIAPLRPRGRAVYVSPAGSEFTGATEVRVVLDVYDGFGCPGPMVSELGWDGERILWERRFHDLESTRLCFDMADLQPGWWDGITVPEPIRAVTTEPMVWPEREVSVQIANGDANMPGFVRWGMERFAAAGLPLPRVGSVTFLSQDSRCRGYHGFAEGTDSGSGVILCYTPEQVCSDQACSGWNSAPAHTLLHEYSHVWMDHNLTEEARAGFLAFEGLTQWSDWSDPWPDRGVERAAEAMAYALTERITTGCAPGGASHRYLDGFRILIGEEPLATCP